MNPNTAPTVVADDVVVTMAYTLTVNGEVIDSSEESDPLIFLQGYRNIIPGLEKELYGMNIGDTKKVIVKPEDGYGDEDPEAFMEVPRNEFPKEIPMEEGIELEIRDEDGEILLATIDRVTKDTVRLNFNHPLAGKTLEFDVKILDLRAATEEEVSHGHAHGGDDELDEFEDLDFEEEDEK
ncbi:MAG: peptidylprolyl isomerase [Chloroflexota bacterium]